MIPFDRVILSCNEDPKYIGFWPIVSRAWKQLFGAKVCLAFLTNRTEHDPLVESMRAHGEVYIYKPLEGIPQPNLAKMVRHILATQFRFERCVINDIDLLPLQTAYLHRFLDYTQGHSLVTTGRDLYHGVESGKFTMGYLTAYGYVFGQILNPLNLPYEILVRSWIGAGVYDHKENIASTVHHENADTFSDESLYRALLWKSKRIAIHFDRGFDADQCIDRAHWRIDPVKLKQHYYVEAHLLRPYGEHKAAIQPLITYLDEVARYPV